MLTVSSRVTHLVSAARCEALASIQATRAAHEMPVIKASEALVGRVAGTNGKTCLRIGAELKAGNPNQGIPVA